MDQSLFEIVLRVTKDYWFLITLVASVFLTIGYMVVFRVNPWDQHRAAKLRRDRVRFHNSVGYSLLESGHFDEAKNEFEESLKLSTEDQTALNGKYLANLFINIASPTADPAIGFAIQRHISETPELKREQHRHIIDKFLGDLHMRISKISEGVGYYEAALKRKPDYPNALLSMGWHYYQDGDGNFDGMERMFRRLTAASPHDYRGYHGLGYALYMKALDEADEKTRSAILSEAANQSSLAKDLVFTQLNIVMDFAEVARSVDPDLALFFHGYGKKIIEDPKLFESGDNPFPILARLLKRDGALNLETKDEKLAWVAYHLAVDNLALERSTGESKYADEHQRFYDEAKKLDTSELVHFIYTDQVAILDALAPVTAE